MKTVYLALGLLLLPGMLWAQGSEKENEFTMSMQIRPRGFEYEDFGPTCRRMGAGPADRH